MVFRQLIYDYPSQLLSEKGILAIEHADFEGVERLAQVLGKLINKEQIEFYLSKS